MTSDAASRVRGTFTWRRRRRRGGRRVLGENVRKLPLEAPRSSGNPLVGSGSVSYSAAAAAAACCGVAAYSACGPLRGGVTQAAGTRVGCMNDVQRDLFLGDALANFGQL